MHPKQKELLNLFNNLLDTILTEKTLMSSKDENKNKNENGNENDKTWMSSNEDEDMIMKIMKQWVKTKKI